MPFIPAGPGAPSFAHPVNNPTAIKPVIAIDLIIVFFMRIEFLVILSVPRQGYKKSAWDISLLSLRYREAPATQINYAHAFGMSVRFILVWLLKIRGFQKQDELTLIIFLIFFFYFILMI